jgi:ABC-type microcin C transport system duplicated ATPase subunit YejF
LTSEAPPASAPLLDLRDLRVAYPGGVEAVCGVDLQIRAGERLGVVGESGSGKSQMLLGAFGLTDRRARVTGSARLSGVELLGLPRPRLDAIRGAEVAFVFQDPLSALTPHLTVADHIGEGLRRHRSLSRRAARTAALDWLERVRIPEPARRLDQYPHELSGGMRQRVMIAATLAMRPRLLVADEPTTALDAQTQAEALALMDALVAEAGAALILVSHDMGVVAHMADRILVMRAGRIVEAGAATALLREPRDPYTRALVAAATSTAALDLAPVADDAPVVLAAAGLDVTYGAGGRARLAKTVDGVALAVRAGETLGIVGESGSGKSSLARAVLGLLPFEGRVSVCGQGLQPGARRSWRAARRDLQVVFQDPLSSLDPRLSIGASVAEPLRQLGTASSVERRDAVDRALRLAGLDPALAGRFPHALSGGQNQRAGIARALVCKPKVIVCDEAVSALDATVREGVLAQLVAIQRELGLALVFISHDLGVVRRIAHRVLVLHRGRVVEQGPVDAVLDRPVDPYTRALVAASRLPARGNPGVTSVA